MLEHQPQSMLTESVFRGTASAKLLFRTFLELCLFACFPNSDLQTSCMFKSIFYICPLDVTQA